MRDRLLVAADPAERGGLEVLVRLGGLVGRLQPVELGDRLGRPVLLVEHGGEIGAGGGEGGGELERAAKQILGVGDSGRAAPASSAIIRIAATSVGLA